MGVKSCIEFLSTQLSGKLKQKKKKQVLIQISFISVHSLLVRQELLTAHDRISLLQDHLAVTRIHSRGTTPLRPSPPDNIHASADHTYNHTYTSTVTSEANHGRFSPVKAPSGSSSLTGSSNGSLWFSGQSSSTSPVSEGLKSREDGEPVAGGGVAKGSSAVPQRTSSFHGFNKS